MNRSKGFTIIELLVVVAIIAVLAAIVLINVTSYIAKGKDAAIKGNLATILINGAVFYDAASPSTYVGFITGGGCAAGNNTFKAPRDAAAAAGGTVSCPDSTVSAFCVRSILNGGGSYCVDSTGFKGTPAAATDCATTDLTCL